MQELKFKIIHCNLLNPISDTKCQLKKNKYIVLKKNQDNKYLFYEILSSKQYAIKYKDRSNNTILNYSDFLMMPSFFDTHFHWVQDDVSLMPKDSLLEWLKKYTWPFEAKFKNKKFTKNKIKDFKRKLYSVGTTGGACYCSIHEHSADLAIQEIQGDFVFGNVIMTMNSPKYLLQKKSDAQQLIRNQLKKFGKKYAFTPRFAITTDPETMSLGSKLAKKSKCIIQTHSNETKEEINAVLDIYKNIEGFEKIESYVNIYHKCNLLGPRTILGHGIYLSKNELQLLKKTKTNIAHCPTSNAPVKNKGLGSGLMNFKELDKQKIPWALGSDIGGGPYVSMFDVMRSFVRQNRKNDKATFTRALYRATLKGAEVLGMDKTSGNIQPGKKANFILIKFPQYLHNYEADKILSKIIDVKEKNRENLMNIVEETYLDGHRVFVKK